MSDLAALLPDLSTSSWLLVVLGALIVGFSKTALPGAGTLAAGAFALAMPAKESTAAHSFTCSVHHHQMVSHDIAWLLA